jgi:hypothetical protein
MDIVQFINKTGDSVEQGDVVVIGQEQAQLYHDFDKNIAIPEVDLAQDAYDTRVCGVVFELQAHVKLESLEEPGAGKEVKSPARKKNTQKEAEIRARRPQAFTLEELEKIDRTRIESGQIGHMVTLGAFAHCKVDADIAPIKAGDLLTTSPTRGHAQKVLDSSKATGAIIGKALGALEKGKGKIPVLVVLQ